MGLFALSKVDVYRVPEDTYVVINGLFAVSVRTAAATATEGLDDMSPQGMLTNSEVARGKLVGEETLNGWPCIIP